MSTEDSSISPSSLLNAQVSVFLGVRNTTAVEQLTLGQVLTRIQDGTYKAPIEALRALRAQDVAKYKKQKNSLPAFTPGCALLTRAREVAWKDKLIAPSQIIHLDVDHIEAAALKAQVGMEPSVVFAFISPSGDGLKLGIASAGIIDTTSYSQIWRATIAAWKARFPDAVFKEDKLVKFLHALCFVSHDPELYVNDNAVPFVVPPEQPPAPKPKPASHATPPPLPADRRERYAQQAIETAVQMIQAGIASTATSPGTRHESQLKAAKLLGGYVAGRVLSQAEAYAALKAAVEGNTSDVKGDMETIIDGLRYGEAEPITLDQLEAERLDWLENHRARLLVNSPVTEAEGPPPQEAAAALLGRLQTLADDAKEDAIFEAMSGLVGLGMTDWLKLKRQLKKAVPSVNLNDLERARNEERRNLSGGSTEAQIAATLATQYAGAFAYDLSRQEWMTYANGLWQPLDTELVNQHIGRFMDKRLSGAYTWKTLNGVEHLLRTRLARTMSLETPGWLPFYNGVLHLATMTLHSHTPDRAFTWQLPHDYNPQATCPQAQAWLHEAVGGAHDQVQVLRAYAKAVVTRRVDLQRYLEMIGPGGTGKGTYTRLLTALVGQENTFATELKHLEANRFESSNLRGKVLMVVTDAERYSGPVTQLKAITGQDFVRMEAKFKAQRTEIAPVMVAIAANEPIQSADYTSGLVRRRLSMMFYHRPATPRDLLSWHAGGWRGELGPEIPGVLNWVLALPDAQMEALLLQTATRVPSLKTTWEHALVETNPLADWANQFLIHDPEIDNEGNHKATGKVGIAKKRERSNDYEQQDYWLYPNYRAWVEATGQRHLSHRRFTGLLNDLLENQLRLEHVSHKVDAQGSRFLGVRLRARNNTEEGLLITKSTTPMMDVRDNMRDKTHANDGCEGCERYLLSLVKDHPPC